MNFSVGTDIVDVARVARLYGSAEVRFTGHWFTSAELRYCREKAFPEQHLAARVAAKESVAKALGWQWSKPIPWRDIEVVHDPSGSPEIALHGPLAVEVDERGIRLALSMAHERRWATATVIAWSVPTTAS